MKRGLLWGGVSLAALLVGAVFWRAARRPEKADSPSRPPPPTPARLREFHPSEHGYVGSGACVECHGDIAQTYTQTHSMARSFVAIGQESPLEDFSRGKFHPPTYREYEVERTAEGTFHRERWPDVDGNPIYDQRESIQFVLGSGRRGRSYILEREGFLFQSPISWYSQEHRWDLSPGYSARSHDRFDRKLVLQCVFCHVGLIDVQDAASDRYGQPPIVEASIGCERCHGPGREHVARQTHSPAAGADSSIVNPGRLPPAEREAVCYQCHLRREPTFTVPGRTILDFRPGQQYDDVWLTYVPSQPRPEELATLVEQHRSSACFRKSEGRFGCTSCHNPHGQPPAEQREAWYRARCLKCHQESDCVLPEPRRQAEEDSCIRCHMPTSPTKGIPHTALTDHRLARDPNLLPPTNVEKMLAPERLEVFTYGAPRLSPGDARRAEALMRTHLAVEQGRPEWAAEAELLLNPNRLSARQLIQAYESDLPVLFHLGLLYVVNARLTDARLAWQAALELEPTHENLLRHLTRMLIADGDTPAAVPVARQLTSLQPYSAEFRWLLSEALRHHGDREGAVKTAEESLARDPTAMAVRLWLARSYAELGRREESLREQKTINRMQGLRVAPEAGTP